MIPTNGTTGNKRYHIPSSGGMKLHHEAKRAITLHPARLYHQSHDNQTTLSPNKAYKSPETAAQQSLLQVSLVQMAISVTYIEPYSPAYRGTGYTAATLHRHVISPHRPDPHAQVGVITSSPKQHQATQSS
jgi:hypothetical protein